jgi:hypothetical protein
MMHYLSPVLHALANPISSAARPASAAFTMKVARMLWRRIMKFDLKILLAVVGAALFINGSWADVAPPRATVTVFFAKDEQPYRHPVDFQIRCYGQYVHPNYIDRLKGREPPFEEVYKFAGSCPEYGCTFARLDFRQPVYRKIAYCNLTGKTEGRSFKVEKFGNSPVGECERGDDFATTWRMNCKLNLTLPK